MVDYTMNSRQNSLDCRSCNSNSGESRISPGPTIFETEHWLLEHAYPTKLKGWLVLVARRHVEALHDMTQEELGEVGPLIADVSRVLHETLENEKEYVACFAESEGFHHIHFHIISKPSDLPDELIGPRVFAMLRPEEGEAVPEDEIVQLCDDLKTRLRESL